MVMLVGSTAMGTVRGVRDERPAESAEGGAGMLNAHCPRSTLHGKARR